MSHMQSFQHQISTTKNPFPLTRPYTFPTLISVPNNLRSFAAFALGISVPSFYFPLGRVLRRFEVDHGPREEPPAGFLGVPLTVLVIGLFVLALLSPVASDSSTP